MKGYFNNALKSPAAAARAKDSGKEQSLPEFVDEMHTKYVEKMSVDGRRRTYKNVLIVMDDVVAAIKKLEFNPLLT